MSITKETVKLVTEGRARILDKFFRDWNFTFVDDESGPFIQVTKPHESGDEDRRIILEPFNLHDAGADLSHYTWNYTDGKDGGWHVADFGAEAAPNTLIDWLIPLLV